MKYSERGGGSALREPSERSAATEQKGNSKLVEIINDGNNASNVDKGKPTPS